MINPQLDKKKFKRFNFSTKLSFFNLVIKFVFKNLELVNNTKIVLHPAKMV